MKRLKSFIALLVIVFIPFGLMIWYRVHQTTGFASMELILYPLLFGGGSILFLCLIKIYFLKEPLTEFNNGKGTWYSDLGWGLFLALIYFILFYIERQTLTNWLQFNSNTELLGLILDMRDNPLLLFIFFGPVLWIGVAVYEELIRIFVLTTLWKWSNQAIWIISVILITSVLIGLTHWSQGSYGIVTIGIKSTVACTFFFYKRRFMPLVYAHVLYDGIQVAMLLITYPEQ